MTSSHAKVWAPASTFQHVKSSTLNLQLPNLLTWARVIAIPVFMGVFYLPLGLGEQERNALATLIFALAAITDWVDGWLARRWNQTTAFGAFLDPVADKLMVCAALVALMDAQRVGPVVGLIIIGREITISALREWMAQIGARRSVAVNWVGKAKTVAQMVSIPFLLYQAPIFGGLVDTAALGGWLILIAAWLTFFSMVYYLMQAWPELRDRS
jgi:CDP-diacylglycerol--glycerol-3-phosphate 3-phosphatidyltransferase